MCALMILLKFPAFAQPKHGACFLDEKSEVSKKMLHDAMVRYLTRAEAIKDRPQPVGPNTAACCCRI
jgi:hypothetical protein